MSTADNVLPPQAAPIDRTPAGAAAFSSRAGVNASFDWGSLFAPSPIIASTVAPWAAPRGQR
jgi:hypothetical protein